MKYSDKSTVDEIKKRFDQDVDRFSNLETGQTSTVDATLSLDLITESAYRINPDAIELLDIGCGAGNYTLKMLSKLSNLNCTLVDLSGPMLERATERIVSHTVGVIKALQGDLRDVSLPCEYYDIILAGAVLHHLRDETDWFRAFTKIYNSLKRGGSFWISDLICQDDERINRYIWERYGSYLENLGGKDYREKVQAYVEKEDTPRSLNFQIELMKNVGFKKVEILHKNECFAAFGGIK